MCDGISMMISRNIHIFRYFPPQNDENGAPKGGKVQQNNEKTSPNDHQQRVLMNNNNNNIDANQSNKVEASSPGSDKSRSFTPKILPPEDDRILKEMVIFI